MSTQENTLEALWESCEHALYNYSNPQSATIGARYCPLCRIFRNCKGCPISSTTREADCIGTPYAELHLANRRLQDYLKRNDTSVVLDSYILALRSAILAEYVYLIDLALVYSANCDLPDDVCDQ